MLGVQKAAASQAVGAGRHRVLARLCCVRLVCVSPSVLTCTLVFLGLQTRRQPVLLANGLYGKTSICKSQTMGSAHTHSGKGFALFNRDTSPIFQLTKIENRDLEILIKGLK